MTSTPTNAPTTAPVLTPSQQAAQANIDSKNTKAMMAACLPSLHAEYLAARFLMAEMDKMGDVQVKKKQFLKVAGRIVGGLPPFTETALKLIANANRK